MLDFSELGTFPVYRTPDDPAELGLVAPALPLNAVLFYRNLLDRAGRFDETLPILEDFDYLVRLERAAPVAFSPRTTLDVRVRATLNNALGAAIRGYTAHLDRVYASHPAPHVAARRAAHRAGVERAIAGVMGPRVGLDEVALLVAALAGKGASES